MAVAKKEPVKNTSEEAVQPEITIWDRLTAPFPRSEIQGRVQGKPGKSGKAQVVAYIDARTVMKRLDEVVGPQNWKDEVRLMEGGAGFISRISLRVPGSDEWIYREDVADLSSIEALKGGASDAFKRAAVKLGIGRYLYDLPAVWVDLGGSNYLPRGFVYPLPAWAIADGDTSSVGSSEPASTDDQPVWGGAPASGAASTKGNSAAASEDLL